MFFFNYTYLFLFDIAKILQSVFFAKYLHVFLQSSKHVIIIEINVTDFVTYSVIYYLCIN